MRRNTLSVETFSAKSDENFYWTKQTVIFKPLSYCLEEIIGFSVKNSFANGTVIYLIKPGYMTKKFTKRLFISKGVFMDWKLQIEKFLPMKVFTDKISFSKVSVRSTRTFCFVLFVCVFVCFVYFFKKFYHFFSTEIFPDNEVFLYSDICIQLIISMSIGSRTLDTYLKSRGRI